MLDTASNPMPLLELPGHTEEARRYVSPVDPAFGCRGFRISGFRAHGLGCSVGFKSRGVRRFVVFKGLVLQVRAG